MTTCGAPSCMDRVRSRGLCKRHYNLMRKRMIAAGTFTPRAGLKTCRVRGCNGLHVARGLCNRHYMVVCRQDRKRKLASGMVTAMDFGWCRPKRPVQSGVHPLVKRLFAIMAEEWASAAYVEWKAGLGTRTVQSWKGKAHPKTKRASEPHLSTFDAALNALGYRLTVGPKEGA